MGNILPFERLYNHPLPLVCFLPQELMDKYPAPSPLPGHLFALSVSESILDLIETDTFLYEIMDAAASPAFPRLGFGGCISSL